MSERCTAIIPAAGLGTRFLPATRVISKELLPVLGKPALHYIFEELAAAGIRDVVIVTRSGKEDLQKYCSQQIPYDQMLLDTPETLSELRQLMSSFSIEWVKQEKPRGLGHAVLCAEPMVGKTWPLVVLPDVLVDATVSCCKQLLTACETTRRAIIATHAESYDKLPQYGVLDVTELRPPRMSIRRLIEKPSSQSAPSNWTITGRYLLPPSLFQYLHKVSPGLNEEVQLTDALNLLIQAEGMDGWSFDGTPLDIGDIPGWLRANMHFAEKLGLLT